MTGALATMTAWTLKVLPDREQGQGLVEYALIILMMSLVSVAILATLGTSVSSLFSRINPTL